MASYCIGANLPPLCALGREVLGLTSQHLQVLTRLCFAVFVQQFVQDSLDPETVLVPQLAGVAARRGDAGAAYTIGRGHVDATAAGEVARPLSSSLRMLLQADL